MTDYDYENQDSDQCAYPDECCMPGPHFRSECHTAEMLEDMEEMLEDMEAQQLGAVMTRMLRAERALVRILELIHGRVTPECFALVPELVVREVEQLVADRNNRLAVDSHP